MFTSYQRWSFNRKRSMAQQIAMTLRLCQDKVDAGSTKTEQTLATWREHSDVYLALVSADTSLGSGEKGVIIADLRRGVR